MQKKHAFLLSITALCLPGTVAAQASLTSAGYSENFDGLGYWGNTFDGQCSIWTDDQTLKGWYTNKETSPTLDDSSQPESDWRKQYDIVSDPWQNTQPRRLMSVGHSEVNADYADRALGFNGASTDDYLGPLYVGLRLRNDTGKVIHAVDVDYVGEMWSRSRQEWSWESDQPTNVAYRLGGSLLAGDDYIAAPTLGFLNAKVAWGGAFLNGNDPINQVKVAGTLSDLDWAPGQDLWIRFQTPFNGKPSSGLNAIDDLHVNVSTVPEPSVLCALGLGLVAFGKKRRPR